MKWDIAYTRQSTGEATMYSHDNELNFDNSLIDAPSQAEAIRKVKEDITELMQCNCLEVKAENDKLTVFEPSDHEFIECYYNFSATRVYTLLDKSGQPYFSHTPGTIGGYKKKKIYGRLDCPSALRHIANGQYVQHRVFFADEETATAAGYRPCAVCMRAQYNLWKASHSNTSPHKESSVT